MTPLENVLEKIREQGLKTRKVKGEWMAQCPSHEDKTPSLGLGEGDDGKVLLNCFAGCTLDAIVGALGITMADLFPPNGRKSTSDIITATYDYQDADGGLLYQVVRKTGKQFLQRRPDANDGWHWNLEGVERVPYRLPELVSSEGGVFIAEGEKDADRLRDLGLTATTNSGGAAKWRAEYNKWFRGRHVAILQDNDQPGRDHAQQVAASLHGVAESVRIVELPGLPDKGDVSDWLDDDNTVAGLKLLAKAAPTWEPASPESFESLLGEVFDWLGRFVAYPSEDAQLAHMLWIAHTHAMECWASTPRIAFLSPEPGSGKTRALEVTEPLVPNPVNTVNVTPAYLFRKVGNAGDDGLPTVLFDEIDTVFGPKARENEEIRGMVNAGHRRGAKAGRCVVVGKIIKTEDLPAYCAVLMAGLGEIPATIIDRSIVIRMRRRAPGERIEAYRQEQGQDEGEPLRDRLAAVVHPLKEKLKAARPEMPAGVEDRDADKWQSLLAIADVAGGQWPTRARVSAVSLVSLSKAGTPSLGIRLLEDLRTVFGDREVMSTEEILETLSKLDEGPWGDLYGKPLNARGLAQRLHKYEVSSAQVRIEDKTLKGYRRIDLWDVWSRYLPPLSPIAVLPYEKETWETNETFDDYDLDGYDLFEGEVAE